MNILINAFAVGPNKGSEPGIGWSWISNIARHCKVFLICGDEYKEDVLKAHNELAYKENLVITFNEIPQKTIELVNNQGAWGFYYYYRKWQKKSYELAKIICAENEIEIIHQLNLTSFREPGYLWKIKGPKFVWGPLGGTNLCPIDYIKGIDGKTTTKYRIKNLLNRLQFRFEPRVGKAARSADLIFCDGEEGVRKLRKTYNVNSIQINETGCNFNGEITREKEVASGDGLDILWVGRFLPTKLLDLAFKSLAKLDNRYHIRLHILGTGELEPVYKTIAKEQGVENRVIWHGQVPHEEVEHIMRTSDLFFFTSVVEGTPSVIMECLSNGLPILCFDVCGFGPLIDESVGRKIQLRTPEQSAQEFADMIKYLYDSRDELKRMSANCEQKVKSFTWQSLAERLVSQYKEVLTK